MTELLDELEAVSVYLPLVPRVVAQVSSHGLLNLQIPSEQHYSKMSTKFSKLPHYYMAACSHLWFSLEVTLKPKDIESL